MKILPLPDGFRPLAMALLFVLASAAPAGANEPTLKLVNGDELYGEIVSQDARETVLDHPVLGRLVIPDEMIEHEPPEPPGVFGTSLLQGWHKTLSAGITGSQGNSDQNSVLLSLDLGRETETLRWHVDGEYKIASDEGERSDHFANLHARRDWLLADSRWFVFGGGQWQYDEFEPWEHRVQAFAGPGYHILREKTLELDGLFGPVATYEFGDRNTFRPEVVFGGELRWRYRDGHDLALKNYFYQQVDAAEFRNVTDLAWTMRIANLEHLSLSLGFRNEYDSDADEDRKNLKYYTTLGYDF
jgi:putative salt-induced outer membrane protein YdiY